MRDERAVPDEGAAGNRRGRPAMSKGAGRGRPAPIEAHAFVLARIDYRDRDLVLRAAVEDHGICSLLARGARGSRRRFGCALDDLAAATLTLRPRREGLGHLLEARSTPGPTPDPADLASFAVRAHTAEVLLATVEEGHPTRFPFKLMRWVHEASGTPVVPALRRTRARWVLDRVRVIVLHRQGRLADLLHCSACQEPLDRGPGLHFTFDQGLRCHACGPGRGAAELRPPADLRRLQDLFAGAPFDGSISPDRLSLWLTSQLREAVGRELRSEQALKRFA